MRSPFLCVDLLEDVHVQRQLRDHLLQPRVHGLQLPQLGRLFQQYGAPQVLRGDNGPGFIARALEVRTLMNHSETATIDPRTSWQNGSVGSFHATLRRECLDAEYFSHLREAKILIEQWRWWYNTQRPHCSLGYRSPAEVGADVHAAMKSESRAIEVAVPVASSEAAVEDNRVDDHPITRETLS